MKPEREKDKATERERERQTERERKPQRDEPTSREREPQREKACDLIELMSRYMSKARSHFHSLC